ncbi:hypothetical protein [Streptomyces sp. NPDC005181]|uniref:hypothetical protein n=1 Tax=Streptomyces sp. NPDC005181 TaxID=3156869 RepID=UPI0033B8C7F7
MHPDTHLTLPHLRSAELRQQAAEFRAPRKPRAPRAPRAGLRTQLGWTLVELGLRVLPNGRPRHAHALRTA